MPFHAEDGTPGPDGDHTHLSGGLRSGLQRAEHHPQPPYAPGPGPWLPCLRLFSFLSSHSSCFCACSPGHPCWPVFRLCPMLSPQPESPLRCFLSGLRHTQALKSLLLGRPRFAKLGGCPLMLPRHPMGIPCSTASHTVFPTDDGLLAGGSWVWVIRVLLAISSVPGANNEMLQMIC